MNSSIVRSLSLLGILLFAGCAARRYQAAPIVPRETASKFQSRNLSDSGLLAFVAKHQSPSRTASPPETWDLGTLWLAAEYFNPAMAAARARIAAAEASVVTAGARPNPTLGIAPGIPSPYLLTLDFAVPIETAGKRGYRIASARSLNQAAKFDLASTAWKLRSGVRTAFVDYLLATRNLDLLRSEERIRGEQVRLLEQRFAVGEIPRPSLDLARIQRSQTRLAINAAEGQADQSKAALAAAIGIPVAALQGVKLSWTGLESPPSVKSLSPRQLQQDAVLNRLDIRRALAQYAASEAALQLEIAKQYPNLVIGPGYAYEEKSSYFTVGISATLPIFNRNQGPIAEAEARRKGVAAAFLAMQAQVIGESEQALALYTAALKEFSEADGSLRNLQGEQERMMRRAVNAGEQDRLALNGVRIESSVLARGRLDALHRALSDLGALEDAVQRPLDSGDVIPTPPNPDFPFPDSPVKERRP
ncbi:MAG TPA: TolC family protein [Candidatus Dormibacteraeota bacterium]|nr:TolC family protein [Candidatus Dormibacteraeota bacterium]